MTAAAADALRGIFVPLITPFDADGRVATGPLEALAHEVLDAGAAGIVALGTTAESATLDRDEKHTVLDVCAAVCGARGAALIAGAGSSDTAASATVLAALAHWPQITGALVPVPSYTRPGEAGVLAHFTYLAGAQPGAAGHLPHPVPDRPAARAPRCCGRSARCRTWPGSSSPPAPWTPWRWTCSATRRPGSRSWRGTTCSCRRCWRSARPAASWPPRTWPPASSRRWPPSWPGGDLGAARRLGHALARLSAAAFAEPNPAVIKAALHAQGRIPTPDVRLPLLPAAPASADALLARLAGLAEPHLAAQPG